MRSKHVEEWNELIVKQKLCVSSWLITQINKWRPTGRRETEEYVAKNGAWRGQKSEKDLGRNQVRRQE